LVGVVTIREADEFVASLNLPTIVSAFDRGRRTNDPLS
jgi:hypothetical protein